jgi:hypothetical protein
MKVGSRWAIPVAAVVGLGVGALAVSAGTPPPAGQTPAQVFIDKLAGILHKTPSQTQADLKQAQLQTVDQLVKDGKITQAQADAMKSRVEAGQGLAFGTPLGRRLPGTGRTLFKNLTTAELDAVAKTLKLSPSALKSELRSGKKLSDLESAAGVSEATVRAAALNAARGVLDAAVKAKTITQAQEDSYLQRLQSSRKGFPLGGRFGGHGGFRGSPPAAEASPTPGG